MKRSAVTRRRTVLALLLGFHAGCAREAPASQACAPCREKSFRDEARAAKVASHWKRVPPGLGGIMGELSPGCLCFGPGPSVLIEGENSVLPSDWTPEEQAARAAHFALHRRRPPWDAAAAGLDCDARVVRALELEADGYALELDVREALTVSTRRYPFEAEYFATPAPARREWLGTHFRADEPRDGVVAGLVVEYRARCRDR